jgi:hypothetical protein
MARIYPKLPRGATIRLSRWDEGLDIECRKLNFEGGIISLHLVA